MQCCVSFPDENPGCNLPVLVKGGLAFAQHALIDAAKAAGLQTKTKTYHHPTLLLCCSQADWPGSEGSGLLRQKPCMPGHDTFQHEITQRTLHFVVQVDWLGRKAHIDAAKAAGQMQQRDMSPFILKICVSGLTNQPVLITG